MYMHPDQVISFTQQRTLRYTDLLMTAGRYDLTDRDCRNETGHSCLEGKKGHSRRFSWWSSFWSYISDNYSFITQLFALLKDWEDETIITAASRRISNRSTVYFHWTWVLIGWWMCLAPPSWCVVLHVSDLCKLQDKDFDNISVRWAIFYMPKAHGLFQKYGRSQDVRATNKNDKSDKKI